MEEKQNYHWQNDNDLKQIIGELRNEIDNLNFEIANLKLNYFASLAVLIAYILAKDLNFEPVITTIVTAIFILLFLHKEVMFYAKGFLKRYITK